MKKSFLVYALLLCFLSFSFAQQTDFIIGADISGITEMEAKGQKLFNFNGEEREGTALMRELGMDAVRLRVWVDPAKHGNWCNKEDLLVKALRAKTLGMDVMIDFHYSDWWADPAKQNIPAAWAKMSFKKMQKALSDHTTEVLTLLKQHGVSPRWVQVGNEISNGMLWSVEMDPTTGWEKKDAEGNTTITKTMGHIQRNPKQYAGFIAAGYDAVKAVLPDAQVIVHLDNGFDNDLYNYNLDVIKEGGGKWDMIGMSVYPYWAMQSGKETSAQRTITDSMRNIRMLAKKYNCDVMIVETGFEVDEKNPWKMNEGREHYAELIRRARNDTNGRCRGVFYWAPECHPSTYKLGAFDSDGKPTDIMRALITAGSDYSNYDCRVVKLSTTAGDILVELYNETPVHRDNFIRLASEGSLDSTLFHRVIKNFMIQGGGPDSRYAPATSKEHPAPVTANEDVPTTDGLRTMPAEIVYPRFFHKRGALAAAREADGENPLFNSSSSQFYIVWGKAPATAGRSPYVPMLDYYKDGTMAGTPWLDGGYTVFGEVLSGLDVVEKIQLSETDSNDRPINDIRLLQMHIVH